MDCRVDRVIALIAHAELIRFIYFIELTGLIELR